MSVLGVWICTGLLLGGPTVELRQDDNRKSVGVIVDGQEAMVYQYGPTFAIPHYWPVRSPSGKLLTAQRPDPYSHHRSLWIADRVHAADAPEVDFYHCWKNLRGRDQLDSGYRHFIRHVRFGEMTTDANRGVLESDSQWIVNETQPVLDEHRALKITALGHGEYFVDLSWTLTAAHGDVQFTSDAVHYAWPYVRMHPQFSGEQGGTITNDRGLKTQSATDGQPAKWIDYSNTVESKTEGLALFIYPDGHPHNWLTREYGTFGPRRGKQFNGTRFTLRSGDTLRGRVGLLIHRGGAESGHVSQRYQQYIEGKL